MTNTIKIPATFWIIGGLLLIWDLMGVFFFYQDVTTDVSTMMFSSPEEEALFGMYPLWTKIVYGIAVIAGAIGCLALLLRKKWSRSVLLLSLVAVIIQMTHSLFIAGAIDVYGSEAVTLPLMVIAIGAFLVYYAGFATRKGWLA